MADWKRLGRWWRPAPRVLLSALTATFVAGAIPVNVGASGAMEVRIVRLDDLVAEAARANPEVRAAEAEREAAEQRVRPAGALDDPMLEVGIVNLPTGSWSLRREDMTMKMLGLTQRLPFPGKRALREEAAARGARIAGFGLAETANRVVRDVRAAYAEVALVDESIRLISRNKAVLEQFLQIAQSRFSVGQAAQSDVLKAQTQLSRMVDELIRMDRERIAVAAEMDRAVGRRGALAQRAVQPLVLAETALDVESVMRRAEEERPRLLGLRAAVEKATKEVELAKAEYFPDFDLKLAYGQRDRMPDGQPRDGMVSLTVGINLPIWRETKRDSRLAEALAMRRAAEEMYQAQRNEMAMAIRQQVALAEQSERSARLYRTAVLPQARLAVEAALAAYKVGRVDLLTLLDSQMTVFGYEIDLAKALAARAKALAEIDLLAGKAWK